MPRTPTDKAQDVFGYAKRPLDAIFAPRSIAVIGATEKVGSVGRTIFSNLISQGFAGTVFPVNAARDTILGRPAYRSVAAIAGPVDCAVIATPAPTVPGVVAECVRKGIPGAVIISAGFKEVGAAGAALEREVMAAAAGKLRIIGPNCVGVMRPAIGMNASFARTIARPGNIGFITQSGAMCTAILDWSLHEQVGFSAFISVGSMCDVGWGDLIDYLGDDPETKSIILYIESIGDARAFLSAAREVALTKPIIVIKAGRTEAAAKAAASHTGALTGSDEVIDAAFRRVGVLRVDRIGDLFNMAEVLGKQPRPKGPRLAIVTNAGGPAVLAVDRLVGGGGSVASLTPDSIAQLDQLLPAHWSRANPIDVLGDADARRYAAAVAVARADPGTDGLLAILAPQAMTDPAETARLLAAAPPDGKPILACWMGKIDVAAGEAILNTAKIPTFAYPDDAAQAFTYMWRYNENLKALYDTPVAAPQATDSAAGRAVVERVRRAGRTLLTEAESKELLTAYDIPTVPTRIATTIDAAVAAAEAIGFPVVCKLHSETITHKTDVGGVALDLQTADDLRAAFHAIQTAVTTKKSAAHFQGVTVQPMIRRTGYELIIGSSIDPIFGPVLLFGSGGQLVEVYKDRALGLPPLTTTLAQRLMESTKIFAALKGVRGRAPVDLQALAQLLVQFSRLVVTERRIKEIDINPLLAGPDGLIALDARVVLHDAAVRDADLPRPVIRPYPTQYVGAWRMQDGTAIAIRPIRPEDEPLLVDFHKTLSAQSVYQRYFETFALSQRIAHERLTRICFVDYDRTLALVAEAPADDAGPALVVGVARITRLQDRTAAEFSMLISDAYQRRGLGSELLRRLIAIAQAEGIARLIGEILPDNIGMQRIAAKLGFTLRVPPDRTAMTAERILN